MSTQRVREIITSAEKIVSFSGAGLSAESGVATFRDAADPDALWAKFDPMQMASQQGFASNAELVMQWYAARRQQIAESQPNAAHLALAARRDIRHITQNVDNLLERAVLQLNPDHATLPFDVLHLHGHIHIDRCNAAEFGNMCSFAEEIDMAQPPRLRTCPECGERMRPGVVWFGESLPQDAWMQAADACTDCDVLIVVGTSAQVMPAAGLIGLARESGATIVVVNTEQSGASGLADFELIGCAGELLPEILR